MPLSREEIAADLATAMKRHLPAKIRPSDADIRAICFIIVESPTLSGWIVDRHNLGTFADRTAK